jgi:nucleotide-binding universal stress UspA family protein
LIYVNPRRRAGATLAAARLKRKIMYTRILVPTDGSPTATAGVREAIRLARGWNVTLRFIHVVDKLSLMQNLLPAAVIADAVRSMQRAGHAALEDARGLAARNHFKAQTVLKVPSKDSVARSIAAEAARWKAELIVMGSHGQRGDSRMMMGSTAQEVIKCAKSPVLLVTAVFSTPKRR